MERVSTRLSTYTGPYWEKKHVGPAITLLAEAGFIALCNDNDRVQCFFCKSKLHKFAKEDDPFVEHARWAPKCGYILEKKGEEFIQDVQRAVREAEMERSLNANMNDDKKDKKKKEKEEKGGKVTKNGGYKPSAVEKKNPLLSDPAQAVIANDYLPSIVKRAVTCILGPDSQTSSGWKNMKADVILDHIMKWEKEGVKVKTPTQEERNAMFPTISTDKKVLLEENEALIERKTCSICYERQRCMAFLPCGHFLACVQCVYTLNNKRCPTCRAFIRGTVRVNFTL